jgi:UDP-N-acetylmuramoylalanine--D-glutamate ligase
MDPVNWSGRKVVVLGLGDTGLSMARWLARQGARVRVADSRPEPPHAAQLARDMPHVPLVTGVFDDETFRDVDSIAISPGLDPREAPIARASTRGVPLVGDVELFAQALPHSLARDAQILAVTGSNGKSTVTAMAGAICRMAGRNTVVAGNIGLPVLDALASVEDAPVAPDVFVIELSSFQLESTAHLSPDAATVLNLTEDHLDRYEGMQDYAAAKSRVFSGNGVQILNRDDRWSMGMARAGRTIFTFGLSAPRSESEWGVTEARGERALAHGRHRLMTLAELPLAGGHNAANALAAHALTHAAGGVPDEAAADALRRFEGLPHRVQHVAEFAGVAFYDDSKGTNVGATVAALSGMGRPVVLIAGGDGKGQDFNPLAHAVERHARAVVLIGRDADRIEQALKGTGVPLERARDMKQAVVTARRASHRGDAVLLSPACASFDMFRNYAHRGEVFVAAVQALAREEG